MSGANLKGHESTGVLVSDENMMMMICLASLLKRFFSPSLTMKNIPQR